MKHIESFITEKLRINKNIKLDTFTDEELRNDYHEIKGAYLKAEKQKLAEKYDSESLKIRDIELIILDKLRDNRHKKTTYDEEDFNDFVRLDPPDRKLKEYLDKEPIEFVEYLYKRYESIVKKRNLFKYKNMSIADKHILKLYEIYKSYLHN